MWSLAALEIFTSGKRSEATKAAENKKRRATREKNRVTVLRAASCSESDGAPGPLAPFELGSAGSHSEGHISGQEASQQFESRSPGMSGKPPRMRAHRGLPNSRVICCSHELCTSCGGLGSTQRAGTGPTGAPGWG